eukprot:TRINITY_DN1853_c0_g1_i1.p1 TRINITY_DN1853_c0_g1~~TRINITY_DN1853_c0_g1_i1.p1  ORF type:complete len:226 (+),score=67.76 TRINITY_DN1853_c0_g1_i1:52-729(+)
MSSAKFSVNWWERAWLEGDTGWKFVEATETLPFDKNLDTAAEILKENPLKKNGHAFVPLCGDSKVVPYLAMKGMKVTCVEGSPIALTRLRSEIAKIPEEAQKRITIVEDDLFKAELPAESVDFIYDTGSLVAIDPAMHKDYFKVIQKVSKPGTVCYLEGIFRSPGFSEDNLNVGPPFHVTSEMASALYQGWSLGVEQGTVAMLDSTFKNSPDASHALYRMGLKRE